MGLVLCIVTKCVNENLLERVVSNYFKIRAGMLLILSQIYGIIFTGRIKKCDLCVIFICLFVQWM